MSGIFTVKIKKTIKNHTFIKIAVHDQSSNDDKFPLTYYVTIFYYFWIFNPLRNQPLLELNPPFFGGKLRNHYALGL